MNRPSFAVAWAASRRIYDPANSGERVAKLIGGSVAANVAHRDPRLRWVNTCAVRMSYILNYSGLRIPQLAGQTVSGADGHWYFYRVRDLISFLEQRWGKPEVLAFPPVGGGKLASRKGVILFEVSGWSNAQGHATLFDGSACYDHCYFNEPGARYRTSRADFWSLQ